MMLAPRYPRYRFGWLLIGFGLLIFMMAWQGSHQPLLASDIEDCESADSVMSIRGCSALLDKAQKLSPSDRSQILAARAEAYLGRRDFARALADAQLAASLDRGSRTFSLMGQAEAGLRRHSDAVKAFSDAISLDPTDYDDVLRRGESRMAAGDPRGALADFNAVVAVRFDKPQPYLDRARLYLAIGTRDKARADFDLAVTNGPRFADAFLGRAQFRLQANDSAGALADFGSALAIDQHSVPASVGRAILNERLGRKAEAIKDYKRATHGDPADPDVVLAQTRLAALGETAVASARQAPSAAVTPPPAADHPVNIPPPGKRVALLIGNASYRDPGAHLLNPTNDAEALGAAMQAAGFDTVAVKTNLTRDEMQKALNAFADEANGAEVAIVFYSGHGLEFEGANYLVPVDADIRSKRNAVTETIPLRDVMSALDGVKLLKLVLLDACRENPFAAALQATATKGALPKGLGRIQQMPTDTLVAYATAPGKVATDGQGTNSPFTAALVRHLLKPGLDFRRALTRVRNDVIAATNQDGDPQEPYIEESVGIEYLALSKVPAPQ